MPVHNIFIDLHPERKKISLSHGAWRVLLLLIKRRSPKASNQLSLSSLSLSESEFVRTNFLRDRSVKKEENLVVVLCFSMWFGIAGGGGMRK